MSLVPHPTAFARYHMLRPLDTSGCDYPSDGTGGSILASLIFDSSSLPLFTNHDSGTELLHYDTSGPAACSDIACMAYPGTHAIPDRLRRAGCWRSLPSTVGSMSNHWLARRDKVVGIFGYLRHQQQLCLSAK
ncbi:uncharacterized protein TRIVIDRAFT_197386 [Trichoderma virens Gv29-8]|uniref:Uncharacterized protein n=1 Tax=Hypocrea virens (strain Gv29-8 / FGSC 10586) TaxID=413071 RepID=G9MGW8_HYPVG|nr:uncharacterized protein TRIVIDRAFT_197386 [Trichoderma virens Gv29-8]EHK25963.1 hypothetical protein TRIVIDRAFT_197386 [Trichoderma virens Gv29-8]